MTTPDASFSIEAPAGTREVRLSTYLDPLATEAAAADAIRWIKSLRSMDVDGRPLRSRFTYRGDSLWWFAELYLDKSGAIAALLRTIRALESLVQREQPSSLALRKGGRLVRGLAPQVCAMHGVAYRGPSGFGRGNRRRLRVAWSSLRVVAGTIAARCLPASRPVVGDSPALAVFVHAAFWRTSDPSSSTDVYIGPILRALEEGGAPDGVTLVGLGPRASFQTRSWLHRLVDYRDRLARSKQFEPIENFASWRDVRPSVRLWRRRRDICRLLTSSQAIRKASVLRGCDVWPVVREQLAGVALLQLPWSARAMDEAAAALDALTPRAAVTYAEAGGWGRALALEARRRHIPLGGVQHGFIFRHWLNYLHEPDEMLAADDNPNDRGFPRPDITLVFDEYAASHLVEAGRFPRECLVVTGSPRLDALAAAIRQRGPDAGSLRTRLGLAPTRHLLVVASKFTQIGPVFGQVVHAVASMGDVHLIVKCHPAEGPAPYQRLVAGVPNVSVFPATADLAMLLAPARLLVTINSTVAIDAMVAGIPALTLALPNNLSPFVDAGAMMGVAGTEGIEAALRQAIYDDAHRRVLAQRARAFMTRYAIGSDGKAATRCADALVRLAGP